MNYHISTLIIEIDYFIARSRQEGRERRRRVSICISIVSMLKRKIFIYFVVKWWIWMKNVMMRISRMR